MFLTPQDFTLVPYAIANLTENGATLQLVIDEVEPDVLKKVLGLEQYNAFIEGLGDLPDAWDDEENYVIDDEVIYNDVVVWKALQPSTNVIPVEGAYWTKVREDKWLRLREGAEYSYLNVKYEYKGVKEFLRPLVFDRWVRDFSGSSQTDSGIIVSEVENGKNVGTKDPSVKAINAANRLVGCLGKSCNTLYGFLKANEADYPDLVFQPIGKVNYFDI